VWGSQKAGETIRQEGSEVATDHAVGMGFVVGLMVGVGVFSILTTSLPGQRVLLLGALAGAWCGGWTGRWLAGYGRRAAACAILEGNRTVLADIGRQTARFIAHMHDLETPDAARLAVFLNGLRSGKTASGGQDLLRMAFTQYYTARFATHAEERHEAAYFANCLAVLHEHIRLQPYIKRSIPWLLRRWVTRHLLTFRVGSMQFSVAEDVPTLDDTAFPATLSTLTNGSLQHFLSGPEGWEVRRGKRTGTRARDWSDLRQRMGYIVTLFRVLHLHPAVFAAPSAGVEQAVA